MNVLRPIGEMGAAPGICFQATQHGVSSFGEKWFRLDGTHTHARTHASSLALLIGLNMKAAELQWTASKWVCTCLQNVSVCTSAGTSDTGQGVYCVLVLGVHLLRSCEYKKHQVCLNDLNCSNKPAPIQHA